MHVVHIVYSTIVGALNLLKNAMAVMPRMHRAIHYCSYLYLYYTNRCINDSTEGACTGKYCGSGF